MQHLLTAIIQNLFNEFHFSDSRTCYHILQQNSMHLNDESELHTCILKTNMQYMTEPKDDDFNTDTAFYRSLLTQIAAAFPQFKCISAEDDMITRYLSPANDSITIQPTDHHIIIIITASGQY